MTRTRPTYSVPAERISIGSRPGRFSTYTPKAPYKAPPVGNGKFAVSVGSRHAGRLYSGVERVTTPAEVAHAIAGLRRYPQENLVVLVTSADGKPLELLRHQVGDIAQVSANPALLVGSAVRVPNGAHAWILHNHPSGRSKLSGPDMNLSRKVGDLFRGTRLDYRGLFAIGRRDFSFVDPGGREQSDRLVPAVRRHAIPVTERIFKRVGTFGDPLSDFNAASALTAELSGRRPGVVLLNAQNEPVAFVPMALERMARLRDTGGADTLFASFDRANARGALVQVESQTGASLAAVENLARLGRQASVPVIDAFDRQGQSFVRQNLLNVNTGETYFSRSRRPPPDKPSTANDTEAPPREGLSVSERPETYRSLDAWREAWASRGVDLWASESRDGTIRLSKIVVSGDERGSGVGTRMMQELTQYADARRARIVLSPSTDFGGSSVSRLKAFYKRFGFVENTGRNRDFTVSESMIREPNTVPDAESARDRTVDSDAFKRWFGNSRAVDGDGKPLVFYRGSRNAGAEPYNDRAMIFLTRDPAFASNYARDGAVFPVYARVERPFDASRGEGLKLWREFVQDTNAPSYATARSDRGALPFWTMEPELRRWLDAKGVDYDGIYFAENDGKSSLAVRSMQQIKSAIGNRGTFDPTSPDIAMSRTSERRGGLDASAVRRAIADDTFSHHVDVYETLADAPESIRAQADREGGTDVEGFFDPQANRVALIAENIASPARAREVARHELIGHYGLENMVGEDVMRELASKVTTAERLGNKAFRAIGQDVDRAQPGLTSARRAREIIALMAERNEQNSIVRRVLDAVRQFLKRAGLLKRDVTDAEIAGLLRDTQRYLRESGRSIASGEREAAAPAADPHWQNLPVRERARLQAMYREAESQKPAFDRALESIAQTVDGRAMLAALKSPARAIDKIVNDYKGDASRIKDLLRGTIVAPDVAAARDVIAAVEQRFETVGQSRNLFAEDSVPPADGYRDAKFNVKLGKHIAEIQVNVPAMIEAKKRAHALYVDRSRLERDMDANGETPEKKARWAALDEQMRSIYDDAWTRALRTSSTNSAGETGRPLRRAESGSNRRGGSSSHAAENRPANGSPSDTGMPSTSKNLASRDSADAAGNERSDIADTSNPSIPERDSPDASFSRASSTSRTAIPLVEKQPTLAERLKALRANPRAPVDATHRFMTTGGKATQPKGLEDLVTNLFDHRNPLVQLVRRSGNTAAGQRFVHTMRTFEAKTQKTIHDFERDQVDPLMHDLADAWNTTFKKLPWYKMHGYQQFLEDIGTMGNLVKHGPERNAAIAQRTQGADMAGSGRTDREIAEIRRELAREAPGLEAFYEQMYSRHLRPMLDYRDTVLRDAGLLTPEMEAARPAYDWYVPLTGDPNETEDALSRTAATSLKSPRAKDATGREGTLSQNVLHNVLERTEVAIRQAGMQDFKRDFVKLIEQSPAAKGLASARVNSATSNEIFEKYVGDDGFIHRRVKGNAGMSPDALVLHDGNSTTVVDVGNRKILEALNGANKATIDGIFALPDKATRLLGAIYTRYNPVFPLMNKIRDTQSQLSFVLADAPVANKAAAARRAVANNLAFSTQWRDRAGSEFHTWREKYEKLGGSTLYSDLFRDDTMRNIEREFATLAGATPLHRAKAAVEKVGDFIDRVNEHMEMASRVALFKALADSGMSERDAALYVKNTMNFETRGKYGRQLGALFTFAGPALFDARRMAQSLRSPRGALVLAAQFALMYGLYGALKAMGGLDDDGISRLDKVPLSQSGRFLTLLDPNDPDGKGWKFPVGFGYGRIALTLAAALHRYADGVDDSATFASNVGKEALLSNFSPMEPVDIDPSKDVSAWAMQQFTPTLMKPLLQLATNQNAQGSPIHKPDEWTGSKLHFGEGWPGTSMLFKSAAKSLYDATGIDVYPETLQLLLRSYGGSGVMEAVRAIQLMGEKADTDWSLADIPGAQAFGSRVINRDAVDFRQNYDDLQKRVAERKYAQENGTVEQFDAEHPDVAQTLAVYQEANREIKALFQARKEAQQDEDASRRQQQVQDLNRRIRAIQMQANRAARDVSSATTSQ
ncbi:hypothetical protein KEH57_04180 [Burkholderia cenocepacia]|nr:hypothetical protein KEH57_04180 [Burkholderia cenocepacia]